MTSTAKRAVSPRKSIFMARTPIHPGEHLAEELREIGISAAALARQIDVPVNRITAIINGQRGVTADTALRLGHWFGTSPEFWLNLQTLYELRLARQEVGDRVEKLPKRTDRKRTRDPAPTPF
jgi:addiction module HigA family antidote